MTTNFGYSRLHPNIYAEGKVCLSILGTWPGSTSGEGWSMVHGLNTVLLSIQSLLSKDPYRNEPGYENSKDKDAIENYSQKVAHESLRISVLNRLESYLGIETDSNINEQMDHTSIGNNNKTLRASIPDITEDSENEIYQTNDDMDFDNDGNEQNNDKEKKEKKNLLINVDKKRKSITDENDSPSNIKMTKIIEKFANTQSKLQTKYSSGFCVCRNESPFKDLSYRMYLLYYDYYISMIDKYSKFVKTDEIFTMAKFEVYGNELRGHFQWDKLRERCKKIYKILDEQPKEWVEQYKSLSDTEKNDIRTQLTSQLNSVKNNPDFDGIITVEFVDDIPNLWELTIIGPENSLYSEGIFKARITFPINEPDMQPRVKFLTTLFHPQITTDGYPETIIHRNDDIVELINDLLKLFQNDPDFNENTHVNIEATKMYFNEKTKKDYIRKVRRLTQRSVDEL